MSQILDIINFWRPNSGDKILAEEYVKNLRMLVEGMNTRITREETLKIIEEIMGAVGDIKYYSEVDALPTKDELNILYASTGTGIIVKKMLDNTDVKLKDSPGTGEISASNQDGILFISKDTGVFEEAIFNAGKWTISSIKEETFKKINALELEITALNTELNSIKNTISQGGIGGKGVEEVATWNEFNSAIIPDNYGKLYTILDMDGVPGWKGGESAIAYIINGDSDGQKIFKTWKESQIYIDNLIAILQGDINTNTVKITALENDKLDKTEGEANDWKKIPSVTKRVIATPVTPSNPTEDPGILEFGDLEDDTIRADFMDKAVVDKWYTVLLGSKPALITIRSGDKTTNFLFTGSAINAGANGETIEAIQGNITAVNVSHRTAAFTADIYSSTLDLPDGYAPTQYTPKAVVEQMITNAGTSEYNNTLIVAGNQIERKNSPDDSTTEWRHGNTIASTLNAAGHPVIENSTIEYIDDYNNIIHIMYTVGQTHKATLVYPEGIVNCDISVSKITDWDNAWDGSGVPTGTDDGWKITFSNPVDSNGAATTFHHASTPIRMKLISVNNDTTVVDMPTDFFEDYNNIIGKSIDVEELWLQYNTTDSLGNTFTNFGPHAPAKFNVFTLPAGRTIYDIEMIRTYSNNKTKWYAEYNGQYLPNRTKYLTKSNVDIFGNNCKIDVKINRVDDMGASWAEFNGWEIRPVIENGVLVPGKVHVTNKGIFTASDGGNFVLLGSGNDVHYIVFKFKGGI